MVVFDVAGVVFGGAVVVFGGVVVVSGVAVVDFGGAVVVVVVTPKSSSPDPSLSSLIELVETLSMIVAAGTSVVAFSVVFISVVATVVVNLAQLARSAYTQD